MSDWKNVTHEILYRMRVVENMSTRAIGDHFGVSMDAVSKKLRKVGIYATKEQIRETNRNSVRKGMRKKTRPMIKQIMTAECMAAQAKTKPKVTGTDLEDLVRQALEKGFPVTVCPTVHVLPSSVEKMAVKMMV